MARRASHRRHHHHHHRRRQSHAHEYVTITAGMERFRSEKRQLGGLMLVLAVCATFQPLGTIAALAGPNNTTPTSGLDFYSLFGSCILILIGVFGVLVGFQALVMDQGGRFLTGMAVVVTQLAWIPFFADIVRVADGAQQEPQTNSFIPLGYQPEQLDVAFVGVCGFLGVISYATCFLGSLALAQFALLAFHSGQPEARNGLYYRGRAGFYVFMVMMAGLSQVLLGSYVWLAFGRNLTDFGAIRVAMYVVTYPEIACLVGTFQLLGGALGFVRTFGVFETGPDDHRYQVVVAIQWLLMLILQIAVQFSYGGLKDQLAAAAPSVACLSFGLNALPAYLDYKMRTIPNRIPDDYYDTREKA